MSEISINIMGWEYELQKAHEALWLTRVIADDVIELEKNTLADITHFQTLMHGLNEVVIAYLEAAVMDIAKMRQAGYNVADTDEMIGRMWGGNID